MRGNFFFFFFFFGKKKLKKKKKKKKKLSNHSCNITKTRPLTDFKTCWDRPSGDNDLSTIGYTCLEIRQPQVLQRSRAKPGRFQSLRDDSNAQLTTKYIVI